MAKLRRIQTGDVRLEGNLPNQFTTISKERFLLTLTFTLTLT